MIILSGLAATCGIARGATNALSDRGTLLLDSVAGAHFRFGGEVGRRVEANLNHWLLCAPAANPGMLEMFRMRDRQPAPQLVPWAGEFAGKYLISAVQALRMTDRPALRTHVAKFVAELITTQAEDGYLGPFPRTQRLLGNWDLWGHYHVMEGLLLWYGDTDDAAALQACRRAADLVCRTYLDQGRRVFDAGSPEMNLAIIHGLGTLYRLTGEPRYFRMMREIEKDWERAGDYLRTGLDVTEFFATPRPRWESLHDLQGLVELWRITGEAQYRDAFVHHWRSIARWDRHNTGGFSSGEQATGDAYSPAPIETCCTVAWMALGIDMLRLTGDARVADELELSTLNAALGAQHPSGRWWTYNTPMDGVREASAHTIVFQARAGTPELNCCSVNGPRTLGMLSEWAVMADAGGLTINWHGPGEFAGSLRDGTAVRLRCAGDYPLSDQVAWTVTLPSDPKRFTLRFRIPAWSTKTTAKLNGDALGVPTSGQYLACERLWKTGDTLELDFDLALRAVPGDREAAGKVSLYRGPILLAYDQRQNAFDESDIPAVDLKHLVDARLVTRSNHTSAIASMPWLLVDLPAPDGRTLRLCDFASAGAAGTRYRSWLPATNPPPPPPITRLPADGATIGPGQTLFRWTTKTNATLTDYRLVISDSPDFAKFVVDLAGLKRSRAEVGEDLKSRLQPQRRYFWRVVARGPQGETPSVEPAAWFRFDPQTPASASADDFETDPGGLVVKAPLRGDPTPEFGRLKRATGFVPAEGPGDSANGAIRLNGNGQMLIYALPEEVGEDYSVAVWLRVGALPEGRIGQVFSAWAAGMDDPLRLTIDSGRLFARIEAQQGFSTKGVPIDVGVWHHVAAVKRGPQLTLYLDGQAREQIAVPPLMNSVARSCALGGNPNFSGNEFLAADFADFEMSFRALSADEVIALATLPAK